MAKQTRSQKQVQVRNQGGHGFQHEKTEVFDDNLLPEASEIAALAEIDPDILTWLKSRAEKEQEFRHDFSMKRAIVIECEMKGVHKLNLIGMWFAFLIIMSGMGISGLLIYLGHLITGSIFSGVTIIYAAALFHKKKDSSVPKQN